jgi:HSP20 family molecular chaperone IbpA
MPLTLFYPYFADNSSMMSDPFDDLFYSSYLPRRRRYVMEPFTRQSRNKSARNERRQQPQHDQSAIESATRSQQDTSGAAQSQNQVTTHPSTQSAENQQVQAQPRSETQPLSLWNALFRSPMSMEMDVIETESDYKVIVDVPGVDLQDVELKVVNGDELHISAERKQRQQQENDREHWVERSYSRSQRVIRLPEHADWDSIDASLENGVLRVTVGKKQKSVAEPSEKKIAIKSQSSATSSMSQSSTSSSST